ncbi:lactonase family protein [Actinotalea sp. BY-33]|uniref:Lactonase family protein n=1 Tax=Actinotalea soli TaxID=2819234 RepID=A0A939RX87_9CELL|nr:beta-propeller fold lactonase family protein [Actinotalea soli]MBO1752966.1 lactonase family protein [Actinotalea soli]
MARAVELWVGTYPAAGPEAPAGTGEGIWRLRLDPEAATLTGELALRTPAPSFLATSPDGSHLYAVGETTPGTVACFAVTPTGLELQARVDAGGGSPCHVLVDPAGRALYVSLYGSGGLAVLPLAPDGGLAPEVLAAGGPTQVLEHEGSGPDPERQEGPHAHSATLAPGGEVLLVADLGTDELRRVRVRADGTCAADGVAAQLPPGTGPRHLVVGPGDHLYVVGELHRALHVLGWDRASATARPVAVLPLPAGDSFPAHPVLRGAELLVSVRGPDLLARFAVPEDGARLEPLPTRPAEVSWPRHVAVVGGHVVCAGQGSDEVVALPSDPTGAALRLTVPAPACVLPVASDTGHGAPGRAPVGRRG